MNQMGVQYIKNPQLNKSNISIPLPHLAACTVGMTGGADGAGWLGANGCTCCTVACGTVGATVGATVGGACGAGGRMGICGYAAGGLGGGKECCVGVVVLKVVLVDFSSVAFLFLFVTFFFLNLCFFF